MQSSAQKPQVVLTTWLFLRILGLIFLVAFASIISQVTGLVGEHGMLPATRYLSFLAERLGAAQWINAPTVFWWVGASDGTLVTLCWIGMAAALMVVVGVLTAPALFVCYLLYLSLITVGQDFLSFQWDWLLLETAVAAMFLAPWTMFEAPLTGKRTVKPPSLAIVWAVRLILFKLMFMSGKVKILSGDPTWANFTALDFHYLTQPLPTPAAWFFAQLPELFHKCSVGMMFFVELVVPFLIFLPRKVRIFAAAAFVSLQLLILLTGNYTFFNWLSIALCIMLLDDDLLRRFLPSRFVDTLATIEVQPMQKVKRILQIAVACVLICLDAATIAGPSTLGELKSFISPFGISNGYGLFAVMTTERNEIIIEGSDDRVHWLEYELPFKPGDLKRAPPIVAPFQPRLDWQLWFASLSDFQNEPWFGHLMFHVLRGTPEVMHLFSKNPFPETPPKFVRASFYRYQFTDPQTLFKTGQWWRRTYIGEYSPTASLNGPQ